MDTPKIGKIWRFSVHKCKQLGAAFNYDMVICQSECGQYFSGSRDSKEYGSVWVIGEPIEPNSSTLLRVSERFTAGLTDWDVIRDLMHNNKLGPPTESMIPPIPPPPPLTLKEVRAKRFSLVLRDM